VLSDGTFYRIQSTGMYEFFDGIDQLEIVSATDAPYYIEQHGGVFDQSEWIQLVDGTFYRIQPSGLYEFFDGIDQLEIVPASDAPALILQHGGLK
jgi:hypothetical protein